MNQYHREETKATKLITVGARVIRKTGKLNQGTVKRIDGNSAYVLWDNVYTGWTGCVSMHSTIKLSALLLATEENVARFKQSARAKEIKKLQPALNRWREKFGLDYATLDNFTPELFFNNVRVGSDEDLWDWNSIERALKIGLLEKHPQDLSKPIRATRLRLKQQEQ